MNFKDIKTYDDACTALNLNPTNVPDFSMFPEEDQAAMIAHSKLVVIAKALNGGWKPDWQNTDERKFFPWFDLNKDENNLSGFSLFDVYGDRTYTGVGSRLCYKSREIAEYAATQFDMFYRIYFKN